MLSAGLPHVDTYTSGDLRPVRRSECQLQLHPLAHGSLFKQCWVILTLRGRGEGESCLKSVSWSAIAWVSLSCLGVHLRQGCGGAYRSLQPWFATFMETLGIFSVDDNSSLREGTREVCIGMGWTSFHQFLLRKRQYLYRMHVWERCDTAPNRCPSSHFHCQCQHCM